MKPNRTTLLMGLKVPPSPRIRRAVCIRVSQPWIEAETTTEQLAVRDLRALAYLRSLR